MYVCMACWAIRNSWQHAPLIFWSGVGVKFLWGVQWRRGGSRYCVDNGRGCAGVCVCVCPVCSWGTSLSDPWSSAVSCSFHAALPFLFLPLLSTWLDLFFPLLNDFCSLLGRTTSLPYLVYSSQGAGVWVGEGHALWCSGVKWSRKPRDKEVCGSPNSSGDLCWLAL